MGGSWSMRGKASEAPLVEISPVTSAMRAGPRVFVLGLESGWQDVLEILSVQFDLIESSRRYAPGPAERAGRTIDEYGRWLGEWHLVTVVDRKAVLRGEGMNAARLTPIERQSRLPHFGITSRHDPARPNYLLYYSDGFKKTDLSRCELELRLPPALALLPTGQAQFMGSATYRNAMSRLRACQRTMLKRLAAGLVDKVAVASGPPADRT